MSMFYDSDQDVFFEDFSRSVKYTPTGGEASTIDALYDAPGSVIAMPGGVGIQVVSPQVIVKDSDIPNILMGDTVVVGSTTYYVRGITPDGEGFTTLVLSEA
jgi:hypothetical protein